MGGHDPAELAASTRQVAAVYLAAGLDPAKSNVFVQSHVTAGPHTQCLQRGEHRYAMWWITR
jgi:tryptophanyl-tRNA synthetase